MKTDSTPNTPKNTTDQPQEGGVLSYLREWLDALLIAYILAMFIRMFCVELFKIPSGSMTPTLVGGSVAEFDYDNDGDDDLVIHSIPGIQVFYTQGGKFVHNELFTYTDREKLAGRKFHIRSDMILVNKFAYWFTKPKRGDIVVFKVPKEEFHSDKPFYIKRVVGLPSERITIENERLVVNGNTIDSPSIFKDRSYRDPINEQPFIERIVPEEHLLVFGDNSQNSYDSRYWNGGGGVPFVNVKGKAFFRYWPLKKASFLH